jgi:hypothetical protein
MVAGPCIDLVVTCTTREYSAARSGENNIVEIGGGAGSL